MCTYYSNDFGLDNINKEHHVKTEDIKFAVEYHGTKLNTLYTKESQMKRFKVNWVEIPDLCERCSDTKIQVGVAGKTASIEDDFVYTVVNGNHLFGEGYDYVILDGKKYRFELVEVEDES